MTLSLDRIQRAREAGYDDEKIIESIERREPAFGGRIKKAREAGYDNTAIMQSIEKKLSVNAPKSSSPEIPDSSSPEMRSPLSQSSPSVSGSTQAQVPSPGAPTAQTNPQTPASKLVRVATGNDTQNNSGYSFVSPETDKSFNEWIMQEHGEDRYEKSIRPKELTPEELKKMSVSERLSYAQDLNRHMEYQRSKGVTKGALSGLTFGLSEKIPALKPQEGEHGVLFGEILGSIVPIEGLAKVIGYPLMKLVGQSPKYKQGLEALARITGMGITGAAYEGTKEVIKTGELPTAAELTKYGAEWAAFDAILQGLGYAGKVSARLRNAKNAKKELNDIISQVNLNEKDPEILKKQIDEALANKTSEAATTKEVQSEAITETPKKEAEGPEVTEKNEPKAAESKKEVEAIKETPASDITPDTKGSIEKNIQSIERQIEKAKKKGNTSRVQALQKNLQIQKNKLPKKEKPVVPIIETTGKSADQMIDVPKTFSEKFIEGVNTTVDAIKNPGRTLSNTGRAINENLFNFLAPLERLEAKIPVAQQANSRIRLAQSSTSTINSVIENGIFSDVGNRIEHGGLRDAYGDYTWSRLTKKMKPGEYSIQELDSFRHSKQALKRQKEGKVTGIDTAEARNTVGKLGPKYQQVDSQIRQYNKNVLSHYGKDLLGKDLIDLWNSDYHTSLYRVMDSGEGSMLANGSLEPKKGFFKFKGSQRKQIPASESDVYNTAMLVQNSKKNDAVLQYKRNVEKGLVPGKIKKGEKVAMPESVAKEIELPEDLKKVGDQLYGQTRAEGFTPSKDTLRGWENGKPFEIEVPEEVVEVFKGMQPIAQHQLSQILTSANRAFSRGLTLDPRKFFSIFSRDALSAMMYSKSGVQPVDTAKAVAEILGDSQLYKQFKFDGGDVYAGRLASRMDRSQKVEELMTPGREGPVVPLNKIYGYLKKYEKKLGDISMAVPFAEYKAALAKYGDTAEGRILAMMEAKSVTYDPSRKGKSMMVREIAPFINFWNVTLQDMSMLGKQLKRPEVWAKGLATITMPTLALKMWNEGNPDYDDLTALDKAAFWHLYFGKHHVRVPTPWLLGTVFKVAPEAIYETIRGRGKEGTKGLYHNAVDQVSGSFNPLIQTSIEVMTGRSPASPLGFLLGVESKSPEVIPRRLQNLPKELQYTSGTSQLSRKFAPMVGASPVVMDRVIANLGANASRDALALIDEIAYQTGFAEDKRPDRNLSNYLVLGNFVSNSPTSRTKYAEEFYELLESLRVGKAGEKHGVPAKDIKRLENAQLNKYNARISKEFGRYRDVQESNMPSAAKKRELDKIQNDINALYKEAVMKAKG